MRKGMPKDGPASPAELSPVPQDASLNERP
jgi:hypothetical protein